MMKLIISLAAFIAIGATAAEGVGSICFSTSWNGYLSSPIKIDLAQLAGQYIEIPEPINGEPAYELVNSGDGCSAPVTLMYVGRIGNILYDRYYFSYDPEDPTNTYYFTCENDPVKFGTCFGNLQDYMTITQGSDCVCGITTPSPTTPAPEISAPVEGVGSVCLSTSFRGSLTSPTNIKFSLLAGQYVEIPGGINGKPAYELVNSGDDCSASVTLMYVGRIGNFLYDRYYFSYDIEDPTNNYYFACARDTDPISDGTCIGNLQEYLTITQGSDCVCGRTTPTPTTPAPIPVIPIGTDSVCYAVTETAKNEGRRVQGAPAQGYIELSTIAGQYKLIDESDENGKPVYELSGCGTSAYIKYVSAYGLFMVVKDVNDGRNTYITWCSNSADITDNDILKCEWTRNEYYTITNSLPSCSCGQTVP